MNALEDVGLQVSSHVHLLFTGSVTPLVRNYPSISSALSLSQSFPAMVRSTPVPHSGTSALSSHIDILGSLISDIPSHQIWCRTTETHWISTAKLTAFHLLPRIYGEW